MCSEDSGNILLTQVVQLPTAINVCSSCRKALLRKKKKISDCMCADGLSSSTDPGARLDPGLLAGVAVIVTVLVLAAACIVVLVIWWRYDTV